jgi:hypothetical protein
MARIRFETIAHHLTVGATFFKIRHDTLTKRTFFDRRVSEIVEKHLEIITNRVVSTQHVDGHI